MHFPIRCVLANLEEISCETYLDVQRKSLPQNGSKSFSAQNGKDISQDIEFAPRLTEEWAVTQGRRIKAKQNWDESKTKRRLCNRTPVSFRVLEMVAVYLLVALPVGLDKAARE